MKPKIDLDFFGVQISDFISLTYNLIKLIQCYLLIVVFILVNGIEIEELCFVFD